MARGKLIAANLLPNPELVLDTMAPVQVAGQGDMVARLSFTIPTGPKRRLRTDAARTAVRETELALSLETKQVLADAADAAIEVLYYQELIAMCRQLGGLARQVATIQGERFTVADVPYRSVVRAELAANDIELANRSAMTKLDQARVHLAIAMGQANVPPPEMRGQVVVEPVQLVPLEMVLARARAVAPQLAQSQAAIEESRQRLALERWKAMPDMTLGPRIREELGSLPGNELGARFSMDLPLFDRNQGGIAESAARLRGNCARFDLMEITTLGDVTAAYRQLQDVQSYCEYYSVTVRPLMTRTETAIREAFQDRTIGAYELIDLLQELTKTRMNDLDLRHEHQRLRTRLEIFLEGRLSDIPKMPGAAPAPQAARP